VSSYLNLQDALYFIPVLGPLYHAKELYQLNQEYNELIKKVPGLKNAYTLTGLNPHPVQHGFEALERAPKEIKIQASNYFAHKHRVNKLAYWGSVVQTIICVAAQVLHPALPLLGKMTSAYMLLSLANFLREGRLYHYNSKNKFAEIFTGGFVFNEPGFLGTKWHLTTFGS